YRRWNVVSREALARDPGSEDAQALLVSSCHALGDLEQESLDYERALGWYEQGLTVLNRLEKQGKLKIRGWTMVADPGAYGGVSSRRACLVEAEQKVRSCRKVLRVIEDLDSVQTQPPDEASRLLLVRATV